MVLERTSMNLLDAFGWTPASFEPGWWQTVTGLAEQFRSLGCHVLAQGEYDVPIWYQDIASFMVWLMAVPWPEDIDLAHRLWLELSAKGPGANLRHRDIIGVALRRMARDLQSGREREIVDDVLREMSDSVSKPGETESPPISR
jgi:hypothetical protein